MYFFAGFSVSLSCICIFFYRNIRRNFRLWVVLFYFIFKYFLFLERKYLLKRLFSKEASRVAKYPPFLTYRPTIRPDPPWRGCSFSRAQLQFRITQLGECETLQLHPTKLLFLVDQNLHSACHSACWLKTQIFHQSDSCCTLLLGFTL